jgi:hypothetical protein
MEVLRNCGIQWRRVIIFTLQPFYTQRNSLGGPQNRSGRRAEEKSLLLLPDLQTLYIVQNSEKNTTFMKLDLFPFSGKK